MKNKKIIFYILMTITLTINLGIVKALDSGVAGGSDANVSGSGNIELSQGFINNFNENPVIRVTAVDANGVKINGTYSVDYYSASLKKAGIYYKGYKFSLSNGDLITKSDDFFGLDSSDKYETVFQKIDEVLTHTPENEIYDFLKEDLKLKELDIQQRVKDKNLFLIIEPVFQINDGKNYVTGTSSEIIKHLYDLKEKGTTLKNIHYSGTLELMSKSLIMYSNDLQTIKNKGFNKQINAAENINFVGWKQENAQKVFSSEYSYGMVTYYVGDLIVIQPDSYSCASTIDICNTDTEIQITGIASSYYVDSLGNPKQVSAPTCVYKNPKYKFGETDVYCSSKITSEVDGVLNKLKSVKLGRFIGITSSPRLTITWTCYSENEENLKSTISNIKDYKMPDIKYSYLQKNYVYKNSGVNELFETQSTGRTDYGSPYYSYTKVLRYLYSYETQYLNKWVDKETGRGSGNSSVKPITGNEYSLNEKDINFEIPNDKSILGENEINVTFDTTSVSNSASNYFTQYVLNNGEIKVLINNKNITFYNTNETVGKENFTCPSKINVDDKIIIPENIIYRPIDLSNPFPGKDGTGRNSGTNWSDLDIETYITKRTDVYSKTPLYSITLTPTMIKEIRKYNKDTHYADNSTLSCDESGQHCYSTFLRNEKFANMIDQNKSLCYNINNTTSSQFDACVIYSNRK